MTPNERSCWLAILELRKANITPSLREIALASGVRHKTSAERAVSRLIQRGIVKRVQIGIRGRDRGRRIVLNG